MSTNVLNAGEYKNAHKDATCDEYLKYLNEEFKLLSESVEMAEEMGLDQSQIDELRTQMSTIDLYMVVMEMYVSDKNREDIMNMSLDELRDRYSDDRITIQSEYSIRLSEVSSKIEESRQQLSYYQQLLDSRNEELKKLQEVYCTDSVKKFFEISRIDTSEYLKKVISGEESIDSFITLFEKDENIDSERLKHRVEMFINMCSRMSIGDVADKKFAELLLNEFSISTDDIDAHLCDIFTSLDFFLSLDEDIKDMLIKEKFRSSENGMDSAYDTLCKLYKVANSHEDSLVSELEERIKSLSEDIAFLETNKSEISDEMQKELEEFDSGLYDRALNDTPSYKDKLEDNKKAEKLRIKASGLRERLNNGYFSRYEEYRKSEAEYLLSLFCVGMELECDLDVFKKRLELEERRFAHVTHLYNMIEELDPIKKEILDLRSTISKKRFHGKEDKLLEEKLSEYASVSQRYFDEMKSEGCLVVNTFPEYEDYLCRIHYFDNPGNCNLRINSFTDLSMNLESFRCTNYLVSLKDEDVKKLYSDSDIESLSHIQRWFFSNLYSIDVDSDGFITFFNGVKNGEELAHNIVYTVGNSKRNCETLMDAICCLQKCIVDIARADYNQFCALVELAQNFRENPALEAEVKSITGLDSPSISDVEDLIKKCEEDAERLEKTTVNGVDSKSAYEIYAECETAFGPSTLVKKI